jgi:hypothetical protein
MVSGLFKRKATYHRRSVLSSLSTTAALVSASSDFGLREMGAGWSGWETGWCGRCAGG